MKRIFHFATIAWIFCTSCNGNEKPAMNAEPSVLSEQKTMDSIVLQIKTARDLLQKGETAKALRIADAMIAKYPGQLDAMGIKADALKAEGKAVEALSVLEKAYALQPRDKETAYNLAYEYADAKDPKALALTDTLLKYDKTETVARAWYIKAYYLNKTGKEAEAMRYYDSSLAADYNFADAYLDKGRLQYSQKKYEAALKTFSLGQKISPAAAEFYLWTGKTLEALKRPQEAKTAYESAYALDKDLSEAKEAGERLK